MAGFKMQVTVSAGDLGFTIPAADLGTYNATVDWGDSSSDTITAYDDADLAHIYAGAGTYEVEITGSFPSIYFNDGGDKDKVVAITDWGDAGDFDGFTSLFHSFHGCTSLVTLASGGILAPTATSFRYCFYGCSSLSAIPSGLFDTCTAADTFNTCFRDCVSLTAIPSGLFDNNTAATSFSYCFYGTSISAIPSGLFDNNTSVTYFSSCFYGTPISAIPSGLFDNNTAATSFLGCFQGCVSLTAIPSGLFDNNTAATSFSYCFYGDTSITAIPSELFDNNTAVTSFSNGFRGCTSAVIPRDVFYPDGDQDTRFLDQSVDFTSCFSDCGTSTTGSILPDLWNCDFGIGSPTNTTWVNNHSPSTCNFKNVPTAWGGYITAPSDPTITNSSESTIGGGDSVTLTVTDGLPIQYLGKVEITDGVHTEEQTVTSWSDTSISFTVVPGALDDGSVDIYVTTDRGQVNATGYAVTFVDSDTPGTLTGSGAFGSIDGAKSTVDTPGILSGSGALGSVSGVAAKFDAVGTLSGSGAFGSVDSTYVRIPVDVYAFIQRADGVVMPLGYTVTLA